MGKVFYDNAGSVDSGSLTDPEIQFNLTIGDHAFRAIYVGMSLRLSSGTEDVDWCRIDGDDAVFLDGRSEGGLNRVELWRYLTPSVGSVEVRANLSAALHWCMGAIAVYNVDLNDPNGTPVKSGGDDSPPVSVNVTSLITDMIVDVCGKHNTQETPLTSSQDTRYQDNSTNATAGQNSVIGGSTKEGTGGSSAMQWSWSPGTVREWNQIAVAVHGAPAIGGPRWFYCRLMNLCDELKLGVLPEAELRRRFRREMAQI